MTEEPTRALSNPGVPRYGSVGPNDPHADPATRPTLRPAPGVEGPTVPVATDPSLPAAVRRTRIGVAWVGMVLSALVLLLLLVFILQNGDPVQVTFLTMTGTLPIGVALLLAAIAGLLLVAIPGGLRIWQLRRAARWARPGRPGRVRSPGRPS